RNIDKCDETVQAAFDEIAEKFQRINDSLIPDNQDEAETAFYSKAIYGLSRLLQQFFQKVEEDKQRHQILDFDDLLIKTRDLLKSSPGILNHLQ
ncbi:MAG: hypothetical protein GWN16_00145, partial [Calditrichae bacterium]|nr:hypothetical protein [Calditrichia bacterium]